VGGNKDGGAAASVAQSLLFVGREDGKLLALRQLVADGKLAPPVLVFVQSKDRAAQLAQALSLEGVSADAIHADKTEEEVSNAAATWVVVAAGRRLRR
jgi:ATP-dependent RNA helicase DDX52/ROK1